MSSELVSSNFLYGRKAMHMSPPCISTGGLKKWLIHFEPPSLIHDLNMSGFSRQSLWKSPQGNTAFQNFAALGSTWRKCFIRPVQSTAFKVSPGLFIYLFFFFTVLQGSMAKVHWPPWISLFANFMGTSYIFMHEKQISSVLTTNDVFLITVNLSRLFNAVWQWPKPQVQSVIS